MSHVHSVKLLSRIAVAAMLLLSSLVSAEDVVRPASARFTQLDPEQVPDFQRHIVPLLGRLGCNSAKCHGSFQGQGGFQLSLFGFDFQSDHAALHDVATSADGHRVNPSDSANSPLLLKPTLQTDHEGGKRFSEGSWEYKLLLQWIESGGGGADIEQTVSPATNRARPEDADFFGNQIKPILEDHCYECHGFGSRKGGLSLSGRDALLAGGDSGPAVLPGQPNASLLIKAIHYSIDELQMPPSGKIKDAEIAALETWIRSGARWPEGNDSAPGETTQVLTGLRYEPAEIVFDETDQTKQIRIIAEWNNGIREDVTCLTRFQTNDDAVVTVSPGGLTASVGQGDTHVIAFYDNGVAAIPVLRPSGLSPDRSVGRSNQTDSLGLAERFGDNPIDGFVNAKLNKLGLVPSELCTDTEFLRRISIDMTGTLPTPDEVIAFLKDDSNDKRDRKVDELLDRSTYAAWWSNKLCDFTGCNPKSISSLLEVAREDGYVKASQWYDWIYQRVARNQPYDQLVEGIMLADLNAARSNVVRSLRDLNATPNNVTIAERPNDSMSYFWTRQSLEKPKDTAMSVAHAFLGIQLQCAECHKHPFDEWTQADFQDFSKFFDSVTKTKRNAVANKSENLRLLRSGVVSIKPGDDPRRPVMDWMRKEDNPWFARAFVNRVWASYFNTGIVDPPDQFTPANPPSNSQLLDWLTRGFIGSGYDMKWLHRQIATSQTYQRSWKPNETNRTDRRNFSRAIPRRIPAEVVYDAMKQATAATDGQQKVRTDLRRRASGHLSMRMAGTHAMKVFGKPDRSINCDCERVNEPTLLQAIFTQNDPLVRMRIADSGWIIEIEDQEAGNKAIAKETLIDQLWLRTVGRFPTSEEHQVARRRLDASDSIATGIADLMWAMMNTKEFLLNH